MIYIGPYIRLNDKKEEVPFDYDTCINVKCESFDRDVFDVKFCSSCGQKIGTKQRKYLSSILEEYIHGTSGFLTDNNNWSHCYLEECYLLYRRPIEYVIKTDLTDKDIPRHIEAFSKWNVKVILEFEKLLGKENVSVRFGVIIK